MEPHAGSESLLSKDYLRLSEEGGSDDGVSLPALPRRSSSSRRSFIRSLSLKTALVFSIALNLGLITLGLFLLASSSLFRNSSPTSPPSSSPQKVSIDSVTGLQYDQPTVYEHWTEYRSSNDTLSDALWDALPTDPIVVAVTDEWASSQGLPESARFPWDASKGRYFIRAFHELHCLKYLRRYVVDWRRGRGEEVTVGEHALHCIDMLRQSVMCRADDTLQPTSDRTSFAIGDGQTVMCRDFDALVRWSQDAERNACHRSISDYKTIRHPIERYAFCPDGSPYKEVQEEYFRENGHVDPFQQ